jgi:GntR family transcriptional regulator
VDPGRRDFLNYDPMVPIWLQVVNRIKESIVTGRLLPGAKLPGGRDLAVQFEINPNTAARVYQELEREGLCETRRGLGTFITPEQSRIDALRERMALDALNRFLSSLKALGMTREDAAAMLNMKEE